MKKHLLYILLLLQLSICSKGYSQGLQFYGNEKRIAERSSFRVFADECIPAPTGKFCISFECTINNIESPGYILYLKNAKGEEAYNLTYTYNEEDEEGTFIFAQDKKQIYYQISRNAIQPQGKWIAVKIDMDFADNRAEVHIGNAHATLQDIGIAKGTEFTPQPFFGMCDHILETASFSIRNLTVGNGKESRTFPLNENKGEEVHDHKGKVVGRITTPNWLINQSYYWNSVFRYYSVTPTGLAFDNRRQKFYIYNRDSITTYDLNRQTDNKQAYATKGSTLHTRLGMNLTDESLDRFYAYELMPGETYIATMDPETASWKKVEESDLLVQLHHHCAIFLPGKQRFVFFGGYGNRRYYNDFLSYNLAENRWDTLHFQGDPIAPRFFASIAPAPDGRYAYIYGGKGNAVGKQDIGIQYYYDCYRLDFETLSIEKLWEHEAPQAHRVPARNMVLSRDGKHLYLLAYPEYKPQTHLQLYRMSVANGSYEALGDSIPMTSEEIATNANLYFNPERDEFYCAIQEFEKYGESTTRIYSIANPPVSWTATQCYGSLPDTQEGNPGFRITGIALIVVTVAAGSLYIMLKRRKRIVSAAPEPSLSAHPATANEDAGEPEEEKNQEELEKPNATQEEEEEFALPDMLTSKRKNSLLLFGTFTATDRNGRDITYMFSPKIRHLFLYLLINSITKDGVLSSDLNSLFWADKPDDKIKNLKNVTMSHLRKALQEMDGIELAYQKGYFKIELTEECHCDYRRFFLLTGGMRQAPATKDGMVGLYKILSRGKFLNTIESGLFDYPKQTTETFIIQLLSEQTVNLYKSGKDKSTIYVCKMLFSIDSLSDTAMTYTVCTYRRQNKSDKALQFYMTFCKEYRKVMEEDYPIVFEKVNVNNIRV